MQTQITPEEKSRLTDSAVQLFKVRNPDFYPCQANSDKLVSFVESQLGATIDEHPFPILIDAWQAAYDYILQTSWFYARPDEPEVIDEAAAEEARRQQHVRDEYDRQQAAAKMQRDKNMPLNELGAKVSQQNAQFRAQREEGVLPGRPVGQSSRSVSTITMGLKATARVNVALAHPSLDRNGAEFSKLCAAEVSRLRG